MYQPPHFREDDLGVQHTLMRAHPLGLPSQSWSVADREVVAKGLEEMAEQAEMQELVRRYGGRGTE